MATTVFAITNSAVQAAGLTADAITNGRSARFLMGANSRFEFAATGTDLTIKLNLLATGPILEVSVDGGAYANVTMPGSSNTWTDCTLFTGLSDASHAVILRHKSGTQGNIAIDLVSSLSLTGASPALAGPAKAGPFIPFGSAAFSAMGYDEGAHIATATNGYQQTLTTGSYVDASFRFRAKISELRLFCYQSSVPYRVAIDGSIASTSKVTTTSGAIFDYTTLASGLDPATEHDYQIVSCAANASSLMIGIQLVGGAVGTTRAAKRGLLAGVGDSISVSAGTSDTTTGFLWPLCQAKGYALLNRAYSGSTVLSAGPSTFGGDIRAGDVAAYAGSTTPDVITVLYGFNDANSASFNAADFQAGYTNMMSRLSGYATLGTKIYCLGILPTAAGNAAANRTATNTAIAAVVTALGSANINYASTDGWINTTTDLADGIHPSVAGNAKIVTQLSAIVPTWTAPASGGFRRITPGGGF